MPLSHSLFHSKALSYPVARPARSSSIGQNLPRHCITSIIAGHRPNFERRVLLITWNTNKSQKNVRQTSFAPARAQCYNSDVTAGLCSGSTGDFGSPSPGSNPGPAASWRQSRAFSMPSHQFDSPPFTPGKQKRKDYIAQAARKPDRDK